MLIVAVAPPALLVIVGAVLTAIVALTVEPPSPTSALLIEARAVKLPLPPPVGVNFRPALPSAKVMKSPLAMAVVPLFWNKLPLVMPVTLKCVTSVLSAALRESTRPDVVCVAGVVLALVTAGVSAIGLIVMVELAVEPPRPPSALLVEARTVKLPAVFELTVGRK